MEFFLMKEKDQVMKTKEKLCQKRLFRNLLAMSLGFLSPVVVTITCIPATFSSSIRASI